MEDIWEMIRERGFDNIVLAYKQGEKVWLFADCKDPNIGLNLGLHIVGNIAGGLLKEGISPEKVAACLHGAVDNIMKSIAEERKTK